MYAVASYSSSERCLRCSEVASPAVPVVEAASRMTGTAIACPRQPLQVMGEGGEVDIGVADGAPDDCKLLEAREVNN